jgi:hypothetical protein
VNLAAIPDALKSHRRWGLWKPKPGQNRQGFKWEKVPVHSTAKPEDWESFDQVSAKLDARHGLGFCLTGSKRLRFLDLDHCVRTDKTIEPWAMEIVAKVGSYAEMSPGNGVRVAYESTYDQDWQNHDAGVESYSGSSSRFATITGDVLNGFTEVVRVEPAVLLAIEGQYRKNSADIKSTPGGEIPDLIEHVEVPSGISREVLDFLESGDTGEEEDRSRFLASIANQMIEAGMSRPEILSLMAANDWCLGVALDHRKQNEERAIEFLWKHIVSKTKAAPVGSIEDFFDEEPTGAGFSLDRFVLNGDSDDMEKQMLADKYILGRVALLGQITYFYAPPNAGKTLLTMKLLIEGIEAGDIDPAKVYYINADDNHKGLTQKLKLAEKYGFKMIAPGYKEFDIEKFETYLKKLVSTGSAAGVVIVLDTIKKFTDIMKKQTSSKFGKVARLFSMHGGSVIGLGHVNKHKDQEGKVIYSGTTDLGDDGDCFYTIDVVGEKKQTGIKTVSFTNQKNRGDVALEVAYSYKYGADISYLEKLRSVVELGAEERIQAENIAAKEKAFEDNNAAIESINWALSSGFVLRTELIKAAAEHKGISKKIVTQVLDTFTGDDLSTFGFWKVSKGANNSQTYSINLPFDVSDGKPDLEGFL